MLNTKERQSDNVCMYVYRAMYVCMTMTCSRVWINRKVANSARGQLNRENEHSICLSPFAPENLVSRDGFGRPVPRQPAHSLHSG